MDIEQIFSQATQLHSMGNLREAEKGYRYILGQDPNHGGALHYLGVIALQSGHPQPACELLEKAVQIQPQDPQCLANYANALQQSGRVSESVTHYQSALTYYRQITI